MKKMKEKMDVVFLLDRSGSMHGMEEDTIGGYNSYLEDMKNKDAFITTVLFDDKYEMITDRVNVKDVNKLDNKTYYTRGCTALLDAVGKTIKFMDSKDAKKVLFVITTDGLENASVEYNKDQIKELIEGHSNWEFIYIGANRDSYSEASSIGMGAHRTANYEKSTVGTKKLFKSITDMSMCYDECNCIKEDWKDSLESYIEDNKE